MKKIVLAALLFITSFSFAKVDFIRVMFNHDGATQATIGWNQVSGENPRVYYGDKDISPENFESYPHFLEPHASNDFKGFENRFVRLNSLTPNQAYFFVIQDSEGVSERYWFKTTPNDPNERLSLIAGGDSRTRRDPRKKAFETCGKLVPHAILFDGDYTDIDNAEKWTMWFEDFKALYAGFDNRVIPLINARGNHEKTNEDLVCFFDCPSKKNYYNVTLGGGLINVICLNTENAIFGGKQKKFLKQCLEAHKDFYWQIPQYHRACRPHVNWKMKMRGVKNIYRKWIDLFEQYGVQLVIECDSHITKVTWPIIKSKQEGHEDGFIRDDDKGIVYIGEGCWGAPLRVPDRIRSWTRDADKVNSFNWLFVDKETIEIRTVDYWNSTISQGLKDKDRFTIPEGIALWGPNNGELVTIRNRKSN